MRFVWRSVPLAADGNSDSVELQSRRHSYSRVDRCGKDVAANRELSPGVVSPGGGPKGTTVVTIAPSSRSCDERQVDTRTRASRRHAAHLHHSCQNMRPCGCASGSTAAL